MKNWDGTDLKGEWIFTRKIDGVRAIIKDGKALSRAGKPLYNLEGFPDGDYEVFKDNWETSVSLVRTKSFKLVTRDCLYSLDPLEHSLYVVAIVDPTAIAIKAALRVQIHLGFEGLVLRQGDKMLKVKPKETYDVKVEGIFEGNGKHKGRLGGFITPLGKVGTGFTDDDRERFMVNPPIGQTVEVEAMALTPGGKFRHPRYVRMRFDK